MLLFSHFRRGGHRTQLFQGTSWGAINTKGNGWVGWALYRSHKLWWMNRFLDFPYTHCWFLMLKHGRNCQKICFLLVDCWKSERWGLLLVTNTSTKPLKSQQTCSIYMFSVSLFCLCQGRRASKTHKTEHMGIFWLIFNYLALRA